MLNKKILGLLLSFSLAFSAAVSAKTSVDNLNKLPGDKNSIVMVSGVEKDAGPVSFQQDFDLDKKVYAYLTMYRDDNLYPENNGMPKTLEAKWFSCDYQVTTKKIDVVSKPKNPHRSWFWVDAEELGSGSGRVELYADGNLYAKASFNVKNLNGIVPACNKSVVNLATDVLFKFNKSSVNDLTNDGKRNLEVLVNQIRQNYTKIDSIGLLAYTDNIGSESYNMMLSQARANSVRQVLMATGVAGNLINAKGLGETDPVKTCNQSMSKAALIECLSPNRRVMVNIAGTKR